MRLYNYQIMKIKNFKIELENYLPNSIIPKQGNEKTLTIKKEGNFLKIYCKYYKYPIILKNNIILSEKDLQAIGLYLAEGEIYVNLDRKIHHSGEIEFANSNLYCSRIVCDLLEKFSIKRSELSWKIDLNKKFLKIKPSVCNYWIKNLGVILDKRRGKWLNVTGTNNYKTPKSSKYGCIQVYYYSTILRSIFINFCFKLFDEFIDKQEREKVASILTGYFAGDGNVNFNEKYYRREIGFIGNKKDVLNRIRRGLELLGLNNIKETFPERTKTHSKALRVYNKEDFKIIEKYGITNIIKYKRIKFKELIKSYADVA